MGAFARCRHSYFNKWTVFQSTAFLANTTCIGSRLTDNGTTVTDNLTGLVWEKKTTDGSVHDVGNVYTWSTGSNNEDGPAFTSFLGTLNGGGGFAESNGWRLPTLVELQTIVKDFACTGTGGATCHCDTFPCIDATFGATQSDYYWSATSYPSYPGSAWTVRFASYSEIATRPKVADINFPSFSNNYVRAVRGGL